MSFGLILSPAERISMPFYDVKCNHCGHEFEIFKQMSDKLGKCPVCNKKKCEIVISPTHGYVAAKQENMKTLGDLAKYNRDKMSRWEFESKQKEYADSSYKAEHELQRDKKGPEKFLGADETTMKKLGSANKEQLKKYVQTGEI